MNLILRTIPELLVISRISSETPNNIRSLTHHSITTQQHRILKCVYQRFVNYADMIETLLRTITNRGIWKFIWLPHIIRLLCDRMNHLHTIPISLCLTIVYLSEVLIVGISAYLVQPRYRYVLFSRFRDM